MHIYIFQYHKHWNVSLNFTGYRTNAVNTDLSDILPEDIEQEVKQAAEISMGTEISEEDILNITYLCDQVRHPDY